MKVNIEKFKYEKVHISEEEINLPETELYIYEYGYRIFHAIIPQWTTWNMEQTNNPEYIFQYKIISIDNQFKYEIHTNNVNVHEMSRYYNLAGDSIVIRITKMLVDGYSESSIRTRERFIDEYKHLISEVNGILNI